MEFKLSHGKVWILSWNALRKTRNHILSCNKHDLKELRWFKSKIISCFFSKKNWVWLNLLWNVKEINRKFGSRIFDYRRQDKTSYSLILRFQRNILFQQWENFYLIRFVLWIQSCCLQLLSVSIFLAGFSLFASQGSSEGKLVVQLG